MTAALGRRTTARNEAIDTVPAFDVEHTARPALGDLVVGAADCPGCATDRRLRMRSTSSLLLLVDVVDLGHHRVWAEHTRTNALGVRQTCPCSGVALCIARQVFPLASERPSGWGRDGVPTCQHPRT